MKYVPKGSSLEQRIEEGTERVPFSDCEYWIGDTNNYGYGRINYNHSRKLTHRIVWELYNGPIPDGLRVLHTCHQGHLGCIALHHLKLGTQAQNMKDLSDSGITRGERNHNSKLTKESVLVIRDEYASGSFTFKSLSDKYGVSSSQIRRIVNRKRWTHI